MVRAMMRACPEETGAGHAALADLLGAGRDSASSGAAGREPATGRAGRAAALAADEELARLPLDLLQRGRYQPRMDMRPETLEYAGRFDPGPGRGAADRRAARSASRTSAACSATRSSPASGAGALPSRPACAISRPIIRQRAGRSRDRDGADREHPAREPQPAGRRRALWSA